MFNKDRVAFIVFGDTVLVQPNSDDERTCKEWMMQDLHMPAEAYYSVSRGYMMPDRIQFFTGGELVYPDASITTYIVREALDLYLKMFPDACGQPLIGNGCTIGATDEVWPPILEWHGRWTFSSATKS